MVVKSTLRYDVLNAVGYWNHDGWRFPRPHEQGAPQALIELTKGFPHPPRLVETLGAMPPDDRVLRYLRSGRTKELFMGMSYCRFGCDHISGNRCLTDGIWVWPEG